MSFFTECGARISGQSEKTKKNHHQPKYYGEKRNGLRATGPRHYFKKHQIEE